MPSLSKRKRFCVYGRYLVCRHTLGICITSTRAIGSIAADGASGARIWESKLKQKREYAGSDGKSTLPTCLTCQGEPVPSQNFIHRRNLGDFRLKCARNH